MGNDVRKEEIKEAVREAMGSLEGKVDNILAEITGIRNSVNGVEQQLSTLEVTVNDLDSTILTWVTEEVGRSMQVMCQDIDILQRKLDDTLARLDRIKDMENSKELDERSVVIRNMVIEEGQDILAEVADLFINVLEVCVVVVEAIQFKTYSDKPGPIKVILGSVDNRIDILRAKLKVQDFENCEDIRIEGCSTKAEVINKQNWNLLLFTLGDKQSRCS